jgi:hypothetical protein
MTGEPQFPEAELARLADGSLEPARQDELRAQVQSTPALARALAEQERAVGLLRSTADVSAPDALRARLEGMVAEQTEPAKRKRQRPRFRFGFALPAVATALAAVVAAVLIIGNGSSGPTLPQTAQAALSASTLPPPPVSRANPAQLDVKVDGIAFPNWAPNIGWRTLGQRNDTLGGRRVVTVFYGKGNGTQIGYAIVAGSPIKVSGDKTLHEGGTTYTLFNAGQARGVTWRRDGRTCVIAGHGVSDATLLALAGDESGATVASWSSPAGPAPGIDTI